MKPFERAAPVMKPWPEFRAAILKLGYSEALARQSYDEIAKAEIHLNDRYQVVVRNVPSLVPGVKPMTHLSIKRIDRQPVHSWRDLQQIKNLLCGPEREAIEIYPAESRLVDSANQYHLWVLAEGERVPFGFGERLVTEESLLGSQNAPFVAPSENT